MLALIPQLHTELIYLDVKSPQLKITFDCAPPCTRHSWCIQYMSERRKKKCKFFIIFIAHAKGKWEMSPVVVGCVSARPKKVYRGAIAKIHFPFCIFSSRVFRFIARRQRNEHLSKHNLRELLLQPSTVIFLLASPFLGFPNQIAMWERECCCVAILPRYQLRRFPPELDKQIVRHK